MQKFLFVPVPFVAFIPVPSEQSPKLWRSSWIIILDLNVLDFVYYNILFGTDQLFNKLSE